MRELVLYWWFGTKGKQMASKFDQILNMAYSEILYGFIESGFVRISISLRSGKDEENKVIA